MSVRGLERLAAELKGRRAELGVSQEAFAARAGRGRDKLSAKTVGRIEACEVVPRQKTLGALDRAADWPAGYARDLLDEVQPRPKPVSTAHRPLQSLAEEIEYFRNLLGAEDFARMFALIDALYHERRRRETSTQDGAESDHLDDVG